MLNPVNDPIRAPRLDDSHLVLRTARLTLRPPSHDDVERIAALATFAVARNLSRMPFPYDRSHAESWVTAEARAREDGSGLVFGIFGVAGFIGAVGLLVRSADDVELGYWLGESYWNRGYATEAARRATSFAFDEWGLEHLVSGHFADNHASGRVLAKIGFRYTHEEPQMSLSRGTNVRCLKMRLTRARFAEGERARREDTR